MILSILSGFPRLSNARAWTNYTLELPCCTVAVICQRRGELIESVESAAPAVRLEISSSSKSRVRSPGGDVHSKSIVLEDPKTVGWSV